MQDIQEDALSSEELLQEKQTPTPHRGMAVLLAFIEIILILVGLISIGTLLPHTMIGD